MRKNIVALCFLILAATPVFGEFVVKESRELLATPEANGAHVAYLTPGTPVNVVETQGDFTKVSVTYGIYGKYTGWLESSPTFLSTRKPEYHDAYPTQAGKGIVLVRTPLYEDDNGKPGKELETILKPGQFITLRKNTTGRREDEKLYDYIPVSLGNTPSPPTGKGPSNAVGVRSNSSAKSGWVRADHCLVQPIRDEVVSPTTPEQPMLPTRTNSDDPGETTQQENDRDNDDEQARKNNDEQARKNNEIAQPRKNAGENPRNLKESSENEGERPTERFRENDANPKTAPADDRSSSVRNSKTVKPISTKQLPFDCAAALEFATASERKNPCGIVLESVDPKAKTDQRAAADSAHRAAHIVHAGVEATLDEKDTKKARGFSPRKTITTPLGCGWYEQPLETDAKSLFSSFFRPKSRQFENVTEVKADELMKKPASSYLAFGRRDQRVLVFDSLAEGYTVNDLIRGETAVVDVFDEIFLIDNSTATENDQKATSTTGRKPTSGAPSSGTGIRQPRRTAAPD